MPVAQPGAQPYAMPSHPMPAAASTVPAVPDGFRRLDIKIRGSLSASLSKELDGREADVLNAHLGRLMVWWLNPRRDVLRDDRLWTMYQPADLPEDFLLMGVCYQSRKLGKKFYAYSFKADGAVYTRFYDRSGREVEARLRQQPLGRYEQITERMNLAGRRHKGVDFKTAVGTPVFAPFRSRVLRRNWSTRNNGNCLELLYLDSGIHAFFLHLDKILDVTQPGTIVEPGTVVAHAGNTGRSTAAHLHYELHSPSGKLLDPFLVNEIEHQKLVGNDLLKFKEQRDRLDKWLAPEESADGSSLPPSGSKAARGQGG